MFKLISAVALFLLASTIAAQTGCIDEGQACFILQTGIEDCTTINNSAAANAEYQVCMCGAYNIYAPDCITCLNLNPANGSSTVFTDQLAQCIGINGTASTSSSGSTASSSATGSAKAGSSATTTGSGSSATTTGSGSTAAATTSSSTTKSGAGRVALGYAGVSGIIVVAAAFLV